MKRLMTALASIALIGTLFVGAPKPVFAVSGADTFYVGFGGGSDDGCGVPDYDLDYSDFEYAGEEYYYIPDGADLGSDPDWAVALKLEDALYDYLTNSGPSDDYVANDGDTIVICDGWFHMHDNGRAWNGDLTPGVDVDPSTITIRGLGVGATVIEGTDHEGGIFRPFYFTNTNLVLEDMTIINTSSLEDDLNLDGGAIHLNYGSLEINDVNFVNFVAEDSDGGAIALIDADLELTNVDFDITTGLHPYDAEYNHGSGGAIHSTVSSSTVPNSTVTINSSSFSNVGTHDSGGALWLNCANTTVNNTTFFDNTAGISGGAIWTNGADASCLTTSFITFDGSIFDGNFTHEDFGGEGGVGGAVASFGQPVTFIDSTVGSYGPGAGNWNNEGNGGGLFVDGTSGTLLTITDTDFFDNSSGWDDGGAIYTSCANVVITGDAVGSSADFDMGGPVTSSTFYDNYAHSDGGAIFLSAEDCNDDSGDDSGNEYVGATIDGIFFFENDTLRDQGGAIATDQTGFNWLDLLEIENSTFVDNSALNSNGGAVNSDYTHVTITDSYFSGNFANDGGGVAEICGGNLTITRSTFDNNQSWSDGGAVDIDDGCGRIEGGNLTVSASSFDANGAGNESDGGALFVNYGHQVVTIANSEFTDNTSGWNGGAGVFQDATTNISGSLFEGNRAGGHGGAIHLRSNSLTVENSTFDDNFSGFGPYCCGDGGAIDFNADDDDAYFGIRNSTFINNFADDDGGAIWFSLDAVGVNGLLEIVGTSFTDNEADEDGGAMWVELGNEGTMTIDRSSFTNNVTDDDDGGAINQEVEGSGAFVRITNSSFVDNFADSDGGALDLTGRTVLTNNVFRDNYANSDSGAVELNSSFIDDSLPYAFTVTGNTFQNNYAGSSSGALYVGAAVLLTNNTFTGNVTDNDGGAVYLSSDSDVPTPHVISNNRFSNNSAPNEDGGAVHVNSAVRITSNVFTGNSSEEDGGAVYAGGSNTIISKNTFINNSSLEDGGALYASNLSFPASSVTDNLFEGNRAVQGGAMWIDDDEGVMDHKVVIASNRIIRNTAQNGAGIYVTIPEYATSATQLMSGIIRNTFERNVASQNGGGIMMEYRGGTYSNARAALQALKKAVKNNRYKANKANLDRATGDIGGWAVTGVMVGSLEEVETVKAPEAPSNR